MKRINLHLRNKIIQKAKEIKRIYPESSEATIESIAPKSSMDLRELLEEYENVALDSYDLIKYEVNCIFNGFPERVGKNTQLLDEG